MFRCTLTLLIFLNLFASVAHGATVKIVQSGTTQSTGNGTVTVNVSSVDMNKSFLIFQITTNSNRPPGSTLIGKLASTTTLEFIRNTNETSTIDIQWYLVEFESGVFVQRGEVFQSSSTVNVTLGTTLGSLSQAFVLYSKYTSSGDSSFDGDDPIHGVLTSSSNLRFKVHAANNNHQIHWQVVEFTDASLLVQTGYSGINNSGTLFVDENFGSSVNLAQTMLLAGFYSNDSGSDVDERLATAQLLDSTTVRFERGDTGGDDLNEISYQVIEFSDGTSVQTGLASFLSGESAKTITLSSVDIARSIALATVQIMGGQNMGRTDYGGDDIIGEAAFTMSLQSSTSLLVQRASSNGNSEVQWQVIEFSGEITAVPVVDWHFDELVWNGSGGEVEDSQNNINGEAVNGALTQSGGQVCNSGSFDGANDYLDMSGLDTYLATTSSLSYWIKTSQTGSSANWQAPGVTGVEEAGGADDILWGWIDNNGLIGLGTGDIGQIKSPGAINDNAWHHIVHTRDASTGFLNTYLDGNLVASGTTSITPGDIGTGFSSIGRIEDTGGTPAYFEGFLDEILIFDTVINNAQVSSIYANQLAGNDWDGAIRTCPTASDACENVFSGGLQTSSLSAEVEFEDNSQLLNNPTNAIPANALAENHGSSCGGSQCAASGTVNETLTIPAFQYYSSGPDIEVNGPQTVGISDNEFEEIKVKENGVLTFSSNQSSYTIEKLSLEDNTTINFTPGDYFIEEFNVDKDNIVINVIGSGTVRIWSVSDIKFKDSALVNSPSVGVAGTPSKLLIQTTKELKLEDDATLSAFVSVKDLEMKDDSYLFGAATVSNKIELEDNAIVSYVSNELNNTDFGGACSSGVSGSNLDHFLISHDGSGINCLAETISITAKDALDVTLDTYAESITLDTQSNKGTWSLNSGNGGFADVTSNDGLATYSFVDADNGVAQFSLSYIEGAASLDLEAFQTSDATLRDDDTESALVFSPSGFTLTQNALSNPPPNPINDPIITQTAGSNFNVHLAAYGQTADDPDCGIIEAYAGDKNIAFWFDYENPNSGAIQTTIDGSAIATNEGASATQIISFVNGQASAISKYKDVGQIQLHAKDNAITGASNSFIVRPSDLVIVDIETILGVNNPAAASATGSGFVTSGESFTVVVESRDAEGSITPNFGNETSAEGIEIIASTLVLPAGGKNGSANDGAIANNNNFSVTATAGRYTGSSFSWDESGIIRLQASIADDSYLGTGEVTGTESGNVGRFYPANFDLTSSFVGASCNDFVYMDQPGLTANYAIQARGLGGNVLFNYDLGLLGASGVASPLFYAENNNQGVNLISRVPIATSFWNNGVYSLSSSTYVFARIGSPDGPYENLSLGVSIIDSLDGQLISSPDMNASTSADCVAVANCNAASFSGSSSLRYGRLEVPNAFGPETENLDVPLRATYYDGSGFVVNTSDSCTSYINTGVSLSNYLLGLPLVTVVSPTALTLLIGGETTATIPLFLSAPGAGNSGSVDVTYDAPAWLEYDWNGSGDIDPTGTASFGHFRGHDRVIYWREIFN
ncbi:MAG: LamG domain-containing protein [Pseudomonadales bacterium]|nr:LamG domain-containing protein [Pseudomonadales bacterium]